MSAAFRLTVVVLLLYIGIFASVVYATECDEYINTYLPFYDWFTDIDCPTGVPGLDVCELDLCGEPNEYPQGWAEYCISILYAGDYPACGI